MTELAIAFTTSNLERMESLGLNKQVLTQSMHMGLSQHRSASKLEPLNASGSRASFAIVQALRQQLLSSGMGWKMLNQRGQCLTINPDNNISIITTSGDKHTGLNSGLVGSQPCTKNGKGLETKNQVINNQGQTLCMFEEGVITDNEHQPQHISESADDNQLWLLLYYFDSANQEVRFELSLPVGIKDVGNKGKVKVSKWLDRLIFTPLPFDEAIVIPETHDFDDEIHFNITPKE
jgi:hypothetical protein